MPFPSQLISFCLRSFSLIEKWSSLFDFVLNSYANFGELGTKIRATFRFCRDYLGLFWIVKLRLLIFLACLNLIVFGRF